MTSGFAAASVVDQRVESSNVRSFSQRLALEKRRRNTAKSYASSR
jgi:hypothetical protein